MHAEPEMMNDKVHTDTPRTLEPPELSAHDVAVERAFRFFLGRKGWRPSILARKAGLSPGVTHQAVMGHAPSIATLRRLCDSLGVDLWLFFLLGDMLSSDDPAASMAMNLVLDRYRQHYATLSGAHQLSIQGVKRVLDAQGVRETPGETSS